MIMVNGNTWPFQTVEQRRYRFRFLNGCDSRFLILDFSLIPGVEVWQIGNEGGFLAAPVSVTAAGNRLLMSPAERADVIVDFTSVPVGNYVLGNVGPDEPFGGGVPGVDFPVADPATTGQIMQFRVVPAVAPDPTTPPQFLVLPPITPLPPATVTRRLALLEELSRFFADAPVETELGTVSGDPNTGVGTWTKLEWRMPVTENPAVGATEVWELYNATADAHPIHIHEVVFEVVNRQDILIFEDAAAGPGRPGVHANTARALGDGLQGHGHRLPGPGDASAGAVQHAWPVRLALPHRRARGQRDDATVPDRAGSARGTGLVVRDREQSPSGPPDPRCAPTQGITFECGVCSGSNDRLTGSKLATNDRVKGQIFLKAGWPNQARANSRARHALNPRRCAARRGCPVRQAQSRTRGCPQFGRGGGTGRSGSMRFHSMGTGAACRQGP